MFVHAELFYTIALTTNFFNIWEWGIFVPWTTLYLVIN